MQHRRDPQLGVPAARGLLPSAAAPGCPAGTGTEAVAVFLGRLGRFLFLPNWRRRSNSSERGQARREPSQPKGIKPSTVNRPGEDAGQAATDRLGHGTQDGHRQDPPALSRSRRRSCRAGGGVGARRRRRRGPSRSVRATSPRRTKSCTTRQRATAGFAMRQCGAAVRLVALVSRPAV